jgi:hypothetical protein
MRRRSSDRVSLIVCRRLECDLVDDDMVVIIEYMDRFRENRTKEKEVHV